MRSGTKLVKTASRSAQAGGGGQERLLDDCKASETGQASANPLLERAQPSSNRCETRGCSTGLNHGSFPPSMSGPSSISCIAIQIA